MVPSNGMAPGRDCYGRTFYFGVGDKRLL
jgi:hypothetical protein